MGADVRSAAVREASRGPTSRWAVTDLERAQDIPSGEWDRLARRGFHRHRWFVVAEESGWVPRHVAVYDGPQLHAIVPAYVRQVDPHGDLHQRWLGAAHQVAWALGVRLRPALWIAPPMASTSDALGDLASVPDEILEETFRRLELRAHASGARAVVWPFLRSVESRLLAVGSRLGYVSAFAGSTARLDIGWRDFDGFVASRSKSVRRTVRRELETFAAAGLLAEATTDWRDVAEAASALYRAAFVRRNRREPVLDPQFFQRLAEVPTPGIWAQLTRRERQLVGFSVNLEAGGVVDGALAAFAPGPGYWPAYVNDLVYQPIGIASQAGVARLELGPTALQAKRLRGAALEERVTIVRGCNPVARAWLGPLSKAVDRRTRSKERRVLGSAGAGAVS